MTTVKDSGLPTPLDTPAPSARDLDARTRDRLVVLLAVLSGATDATGFLAFGSAFTSVMTGNMVLVGMAVGTGDESAAGLIVAAIVSYIAGVAAGSRVAGQPQDGDGPWPPAVTRALALEFALLAGYAVTWWSLGSHPSRVWFALLLAFNAAALGVQSSAILRFGATGLSTTYLTGTLTTMVRRLATRQPLHSVRHSARILAGLILGAAGGAALVTNARPLAPALQLGLLLIVLVTVRLCQRSRPSSAAAGTAPVVPGAYRGQTSRSTVRAVSKNRSSLLASHTANWCSASRRSRLSSREARSSRYSIVFRWMCSARAAALMLPPDWM